MKEQDLLESFSGISEDLLKRSEDNKKLGSNEKTAAGKGNGKAGNAWRRLGYIAAILLLTAGITILFININNKNENGVTDITGENTENNEKEKVAEEVSVPDFLETYTVSAAEYPTTLKKPDYNEFDLNGDKIWDGDENRAYSEAAQEWAKQVAEQKNIEGYDKDGGKSSILSFNFKTMAQLLKENDHENRVYSPINIYIALGMMAETSEGNTRKQILDLLGIETIEALRIQIKGLWNSVYTDDKIKSILASSIWLRDDMDYKKETLDSLARNYYASSFSGKMGSEEYSEAFRNWMNAQTDGILKEQVSGLELNQDVVMALATTVCFSAKWVDEFKKENTKSETFHASSGDIQCDFMHRSDSGAYFWGDSFGAIVKWFDGAFGGYNGYMSYILPDEGVSVYDLLQDEQVMQFIDQGLGYGQSKQAVINMSIPKFDISSKQDLIEDLQKLGITDAFDAVKADFSPVSDSAEDVSDGNIYINKVEHGVRVIEDEEGVKAAAYTVEEYDGASMPPEEKVDFVLDRPFIFIISYGNGIPMFIGIVENP
jgi:serine protease inhibitor